MRAIILAAGRGSRMGEHTTKRPKCMTLLAGKPLLHWQIESLRQAGIDEIVVVRGYLAETLTGDFSTVDNPRWEQTNMAASLACAASWLESAPAIISYSDIVYHPDHIRALMASPDPITITADLDWHCLWSRRFADPLSDAETFAQVDGRLTDIGGKPASLAEIHGQYMGLLRFTPPGWAAMALLYHGLSPEHRDRLDMTSWLRMAITAGIPIGVTSVRGGWCEIDSATDLQICERELRQATEQGRRWSHDWRWQ